ncbi:metallophosphoesterase [Paenibacillus mucilaginosus]|uniref:Metallophosphoesterase n=1 Tax=Paenibacillus mucilaginosus (strain KNP414) TaxID=1036673 RepID=F8FND1_PAEMK|nr:metallophosphoesterase [Paenibacillus mucilaginosus]AEI38968.1 metallophosphoesterase [Paenibacillus mucilaginosus KNP414]MCG7216588.1 metallophosphoesterase [Paenibacillus mucilaginosus]WDM28012.1 metallophosphoesterase [Paenibacillus mucilaginosus]
MTRTLVISDIHGCITELQALLRQMAYRPDADRLLLLGDYVDRGPDSRAVVEEVMRLVRGGAEALRGNHDQRFVDLMLGRPEHADKFVKHGGLQTLQSYGITELPEGPADPLLAEKLGAAAEAVRSRFGDHLAFLDSLPHYAEDDRHIYAHAGLHPQYTPWHEQPLREFLLVREAFLPHPVTADRTVVFGHTKTVDIHGTPEVWFAGDKIGIDGGCPFGFRLNGLEITESGAYAVHHVLSSCRWVLKD